MEIDGGSSPHRQWANRLDSLERHLERTADPIDPIPKNHRTKDSPNDEGLPNHEGLPMTDPDPTTAQAPYDGTLERTATGGTIRF